ncbi:MAG: efflux RND transporter permease subunit [Candidatus Marinimicrobia bacterium]|nr:efflux RND transporter permease subunit [Candidatus Neomarinimicrobiota bacterium]
MWLDKIVRFSIENRFTVLVAAIVVMGLGFFIAVNMNVDVFPDLTAPTVTLMTEAHGMATEDVERLITFPIETIVNGAGNVRRVRSKTYPGVSIVWIDFDWGMDIYKARQIVSEKMAGIRDNLPHGSDEPFMTPQSSIMGEVMLIAVTSDSISTMDLRTLSEWQIRQRLLAVNGVAQVIVMGGDVKQYQALLNPEKMRYYDISLEDVYTACQNLNSNSSGGIINEFNQEYLIRGMARTTDIEKIAKSVVKMNGPDPILLSDIAMVKTGKAEPKIGDAFLNGQEAVIITVLKQPQTNTLKLTRKIDIALEDLSQNLPSHIKINSHVFRQADFINISINNVKNALVQGGVLVTLILFFFLMNYRTTLISLLAIPLSLLATVILLKIIGMSINAMVLGGMAIAIGVLVDDAIVDVENSYKRLRENFKLPKALRRPVDIVNFDASVEIRSTIINTTLIIIAAFSPLFFLSGMEGRMLRPLGTTFIISLIASTLVALAVTPALCSLLLSSDKQLSRHKNRNNKLVSHLNDKYITSLEYTLRYPKIILILVALLLVTSIATLFTLGRSFLPDFNEGTLVINTIAKPGISLEANSRLNKQIEVKLLDMEEIQYISRRSGRAEQSAHMHGGSYSAEIDIPYQLKNRTQKEFLTDLRHRLISITGLNISVGQPLSHRIDHMLSGTNAAIALKIFGEDLNIMAGIAQSIEKEIKTIPGIVDLRIEPQVEIPQYQIIPKREMMAKYSITLAQFNEFIQTAIAGAKVSQVFDGDRNFDFILRYDTQFRNTLESIKNILIDSPVYGKVPLSYVAELKSTSGPNMINRENVQRKLVVSANIAGRDLHSIISDIQKTINKKINIPENYRIEYGGQFESEAKSSKIILVTSIFAVLIIFMLLLQQFKSLKTTGIVMLNLPLAIIGGIFALRFTSGILSIPGLIGFITLFGIAARNGILLVSRFETLQSEGMCLRNSIIKGARERLDPILMTALTAIFALVPLALAGDKPGNEIQSPMAIVILGGLITSTFLNIYIVPIIYSMFCQKEIKGVTDETK